MDCSRTLQKLSALFQLHSENWLEVDFSRWGNPGYDNETFELLKSAVIRRRNVKLRYAGSCEEIRERTVQPYKLVYKAKAWYLQAICTEKQDWRIFKLNRILELEALKLETQTSIQPLFLHQTALLAAKDIAAARVNGSLVITDLVQSASGNVGSVFYRVRREQAAEAELFFRAWSAGHYTAPLAKPAKNGILSLCFLPRPG